jgi:hypothetical protein
MKREPQDDEPTGASDLEFDLVAEMHSLLKGNDALEQYIEDAEEAGDEEAAECFRKIHEQNRANAEKLRGLLAKQFSRAA